MPGARQRRRKKHRGTQAGTVRRRGRTSRPTSRTETRGDARQRRQDRLNRPPSWRGAVNRAALAAGVFFIVLVLLLKQSLAPSLSIALFMLLVYIPLGYGMDSFLYRLRQRRKERDESAQRDG
jgi:hypothetical protein